MAQTKTKKPKKAPVKKRISAKKKARIVSKKKVKIFQRPLQFYLSLIAIVFLGLIISHLWSISLHQVLGDKTNLSASTLLVDTNNYRVQNNESSLTLNNDLMVAAQTKANDMVARDYWSHDTPNGIPPWTFITNAGYLYQSAGENLAYGFISSQAVLSAWMNSTEHRDNILNSSFQNVGFGIAYSSNYQGQGPETLVVAEYGQPASQVVLASSKNISTNSPAPKAIGRIQQLTNIQSNWLEVATVGISLVILAFLIVKHLIKIKRIITNSETFIHQHPWFDLGLTTVVMLGYIFSRTAGYIG